MLIDIWVKDSIALAVIGAEHRQASLPLFIGDEHEAHITGLGDEALDLSDVGVHRLIAHAGTGID